jgi:hypothetical protein
MTTLGVPRLVSWITQRVERRCNLFPMLAIYCMKSKNLSPLVPFLYLDAKKLDLLNRSSFFVVLTNCPSFPIDTARFTVYAYIRQ